MRGPPQVMSARAAPPSSHHPDGNPEANLKSISHRCYLREAAFQWELTKATIDLPLGCLQGGYTPLFTSPFVRFWGANALGANHTAGFAYRSMHIRAANECLPGTHTRTRTHTHQTHAQTQRDRHTRTRTHTHTHTHTCYEAVFRPVFDRLPA